MPRNELGGPPAYRKDFSLPLYSDFLFANILVIGEGLLPEGTFAGSVRIPHNVVVSFYEIRNRNNIVSDVCEILQSVPMGTYPDHHNRAIERYAMSNIVPNYQIIPQKGVIGIPFVKSQINSWCFHRKKFRIYGDYQLLEREGNANLSITESRFRNGEPVYLKQMLTDLTKEEFMHQRGEIDYFHFHFFV